MRNRKTRQVAPPPPGRAVTLFQILICALLITVGGVFYTWQRYQYVRVGYEVAALRTRLGEIQRRMEPYQVERDFLTRPDRIDAIARERLGMRAPYPSQIILMEGHGPVSGTD